MWDLVGNPEDRFSHNEAHRFENLLHLQNRSSVNKWSLVVRKPVFGFTRSHTNRAVQSQKIVGDLKFRIKEEERLYNPCSENKGADQLRDYREADLRLCFRIYKKPVFS